MDLLLVVLSVLVHCTSPPNDDGDRADHDKNRKSDEKNLSSANRHELHLRLQSRLRSRLPATMSTTANAQTTANSVTNSVLLSTIFAEDTIVSTIHFVGSHIGIFPSCKFPTSDAGSFDELRSVERLETIRDVDLLQLVELGRK